MADVNYALGALGAIATAQRFATGYPPSNYIDGNDITEWRAGSSSGGWTQIDLGAPQYITLCEIRQGPSYMTGITLQKSDNGTDFTNVVAVPQGTGEHSVEVGGLSARYWRLAHNGTNGGNAQMQSWRLWGPAEAPPPPTTPVCDYISAWLDGIEANFVPCVQDWLDAQ